MQNTATYLRDTKDVLNLLKDLSFDPATSILVGLDIENLYTSLPHETTFEVFEGFLMNRTWEYATPRHFILECARLALTKNYFQFEETIYLQTHGRPMDSTFAPSVAGLYVHHLETNCILHESDP